MSDETERAEPEGSLERMTEIVRALKDMLASDGWKFYISHVQEQALRRRNKVLFEPLPSMDKVLEQEFMKGEYNGWASAGELPTQIISDYSQRIEEHRASQQEGDEE